MCSKKYSCTTSTNYSLQYGRTMTNNYTQISGQIAYMKRRYTNSSFEYDNLK